MRGTVEQPGGGRRGVEVTGRFASIPDLPGSCLNGWETRYEPDRTVHIVSSPDPTVVGQRATWINRVPELEPWIREVKITRDRSTEAAS